MVLESNTTAPLDCLVDEASFRFAYAADGHSFGALMLENKLARSVYVPPLSQQTLVCAFMPVKSGLVDLQRLVLRQRLTKRDFAFVLNYKMLIN